MSESDVQSWAKSLVRIREESQGHRESMAKSLGNIYTQIDTLACKTALAVQDLMKQFKKAIEEGIDNFKSPEEYDTKSVKLHPWTEELAAK